MNGMTYKYTVTCHPMGNAFVDIDCDFELEHATETEEIYTVYADENIEAQLDFSDGVISYSGGNEIEIDLTDEEKMAAYDAEDDGCDALHILVGDETFSKFTDPDRNISDIHSAVVNAVEHGWTSITISVW